MAVCKNLMMCVVLILSGGQAFGQEVAAGLTTVYVGGGQAITDDPSKNDSMPFAFGIMHQNPDTGFVVGLDFGFEGTMIDSTYRRDAALSQGTSFNVLVGGNLIDDGGFKTDAALLLGMRKSVVDCPDSYLGFACYAGADPDYQYQANFGAVITVSVNKTVIGLRATGESTQLLLGMRF